MSSNVAFSICIFNFVSRLLDLYLPKGADFRARVDLILRHDNGLGTDAIIVATREDPDSGSVRVTAAVEQGNAPTVEEEILEKEKDDVAEILTDIMLRHRVFGTVAEKIVSTALSTGLDTAKEALTAALETLYTFRPLPQERYDKPLILVGPPGTGKTLSCAKLAARAVMNGLKPAVITTDMVRAGGIEQLAALTKVLELDCIEAEDKTSLQKAIEDNQEADQIIVDTAGRNPFSPEDMKELAQLITAADFDAILVMPAGGDAEESAEMAQAFGVLEINWLLPTRLDITRRLGGLLSAVEETGLVFADVSPTPNVAEGLIPLSSERLAELLMRKGPK